jgi:hypothetical protein
LTGGINQLVSQSQLDDANVNRTTTKEQSQVPCKRIQNPATNPPDSSLLCGPEISILDSTTDKASNIVELRVVANEKGRVIVAEPISGNSALYGQAVEMIKRRRFKPKILSGRRVKNEMIIKFVFSPSKTSQPSKEPSKPRE